MAEAKGTSTRIFASHDYPDQQITGLIIAAGYAVHRAFGFGFLEAVYRRALVAELRYRKATVEQEAPFHVSRRGEEVGVCRADIVVERRIIVEVKTGLLPDPIAPAQLLNYLRASNIELGLVLYFGQSLEVKRIVNGGESRERRRPPSVSRES